MLSLLAEAAEASATPAEGGRVACGPGYGGVLLAGAGRPSARHDLHNEFHRVWGPTKGRRHVLTVDPDFLGPFVYYDERSRTRFLVDGQQRFTTLHLMFLMFLHLHRLAAEYGEEETARSLDHLIVHYSSGGEVIRQTASG